MGYRICSREKDIMSAMWNVFASFGYKDAVLTDGNTDINSIKRLAVDNDLECSIMICGSVSDKAKAEVVSVAIEAALAVGFEDLKIELSCSRAVADILYLYSLDEYCSFKEGDYSFVGYSGDEVIFKGCLSSDVISCDFDLVACAKADAYVSTSVPETIVYTEPEADGIGYEIAYTMRLSGCLVTTYVQEGSINDCEKYAKENSIGSIIRVFADGKIQIKELGSDSITETDYNTFVGYYEDADEHEHACDCGHDHDHDHDCDCGCH